MSDSPKAFASLSRGFIACFATLASFLAGFFFFISLYEDARQRYNIYQGDMDPGGAIFALLGAFLGAASGLTIYWFCTKTYRYTGIAALIAWLFFSPIGGMAIWGSLLAIRKIVLNADTHAQFDLTLFMPISLWWLAFLLCGIAALLASHRKPESA